MKHSICLFLLIIGSMASLTLDAQDLQAYFDYKIFQSPDQGSYVETHLNFVGNSLAYAPYNDSLLQAKVETTIMIKQGEEVIDFKKIIIESPIVDLGTKVDFLDIQRFVVNPGEYELEVLLVDLNIDPLDQKNLSQKFTINQPSEQPEISDITFVQAFQPTETVNDLSKYGYDILPYVSTYFPSNLDVLMFYAEAYRTNVHFGDDENYLLEYRLLEKDTHLPVADMTIYKRKKAKEVDPIVEIMDISGLPTGYYMLEVNVKDRESNLITSKSTQLYRNNFKVIPEKEDLEKVNVERTFVRSYTSKDSLLEDILCLFPISTTVERSTIDYQMPNSDLTTMQQFFYNFWERRDPDHPESAWKEYLQQVELVQDKYGTQIKKGYQTDRGRIYLQYGPPNSIMERHHDPDAYPYEIWHYYKIGQFNNKRFLFWNRDLVHNEFDLLQSDMYGEVKNPRWNILIFERNNNLSDINRNSALNENARILEDLYYNPR